MAMDIIILPELVSWVKSVGPIWYRNKVRRCSYAGGSGRRQVGHSIFISIHLCKQPEWKKWSHGVTCNIFELSPLFKERSPNYANKLQERIPSEYHAVIRSMCKIDGSHANDTICCMICFLIKSSVVAIFLRQNLQTIIPKVRFP